MNIKTQQISTEALSNDTIDPCEQYKTWEEIPVSTLWFNSNTSQVCFVAIDRSVAVNRINEISLPTNTKAYEYKENIKLKENEVLLQVELDTTNMFDTTNLSELKDGNTNNASLIRIVQPITHLGYTNYIIVYIIKNNRAVKNIQKVQ